MKRLFGFLALLALISLAKPDVASADGVALGAFCQALAPGSNRTQGECVKMIATLGPAICKADSNNNGIRDGVEFFGNTGECVSEIQQLYRDLIRTD